MFYRVFSRDWGRNKLFENFSNVPKIYHFQFFHPRAGLHTTQCLNSTGSACPVALGHRGCIRAGDAQRTSLGSPGQVLPLYQRRHFITDRRIPSLFLLASFTTGFSSWQYVYALSGPLYLYLGMTKLLLHFSLFTYICTCMYICTMYNCFVHV